MIRGTIAVLVLLLLGAVGYYMYRDTSERSNVEKAQAAAERVGEKVVDQGVAGLVKVRLGKELGIDAARFLHVHHDHGRTLVYGIVAPSIDAERIRSVVSDVPGVKDVDVRVMQRDDTTDAALGGETLGDPQGEDDPAPPIDEPGE